MTDHLSRTQKSGSARDVLDCIAFHQLWDRLRAREPSDESFYVTMLGYVWGQEASARRHAARHRWFHQDRGRVEHLRVRNDQRRPSVPEAEPKRGEPMRVFCIDGVVVETDYEPTREDLESQALMPIEGQPIMAGVLPRDISILSPDTAERFIETYGGTMVEDRNTETFRDVGEALGSEGTPEWPR